MSQSTVKKIPNNYFDGMPVTGFHKIVFFIIMMAYFCEQMDNWNFGFNRPPRSCTHGACRCPTSAWSRSGTSSA